MSSKIGYVVLHYNTVDETILCVESIVEKNKNVPYEIIVVDNASPNKSGEELVKKYAGTNVHVIVNDKNLGFAAGNNIGFRYAKYELGCEYICLLNNDTLLITDNFAEAVMNKYSSVPFWVLGPDIVTPSGLHQNPQYLLIKSLADVDKEISKLTTQEFLNKLGLFFITKAIKDYTKNIIRIVKHLPPPAGNTTYMNEQTGIQLSGAFLIFSPDYVKKYESVKKIFSIDDCLYMYYARLSSVFSFISSSINFPIRTCSTSSYPRLTAAPFTTLP